MLIGNTGTGYFEVACDHAKISDVCMKSVYLISCMTRLNFSPVVQREYQCTSSFVHSADYA